MSRSVSSAKKHGRPSSRGPGTSALTLMGGVAVVDVSNSLEIGDALAAIKEATDPLEVLKEQPRPQDLAAVIEEIVKPCRNCVRALVGLGDRHDA